MKRTVVLIGFLQLFFFGCNFGQNPSTYNLSGQIQKGPFVSGTTIKIQELDSSLNPTGLTYETTTNDDFGSFSISSKLTSSFVEVIATGYYFNEVSGTLSDGPLTLRAITNLVNSSIVNVNILTTLQINRLKKLVANGLSLDEAIIQSEGDVLSVFNINEASSTFTAMDISKEGNQNAILLAISSIMQSTNTVAQLSELISHLGLALSQSGSVTDEQLIEQLKDNSYNLDLQHVRTNLLNRYNNLGLSVIIPEFENYALLLNTKKPTVLSVTPSSSSITKIPGQIIKATFSQKMNASTIDNNSFIVKNGTLQIQGIVSYDPVTLTISFSPEQLFTAGNTYSVELLSSISDFAGNKLAERYTWEFIVEDATYCYIKWSPQGCSPPYTVLQEQYSFSNSYTLNFAGTWSVATSCTFSGAKDFSRLQEGDRLEINGSLSYDQNLGYCRLGQVTRKNGILYFELIAHYQNGYSNLVQSIIKISYNRMSDLKYPDYIEQQADQIYPWNGTWGTYMYTGFDQIWP